MALKCPLSFWNHAEFFCVDPQLTLRHSEHVSFFYFDFCEKISTKCTENRNSLRNCGFQCILLIFSHRNRNRKRKHAQNVSESIADQRKKIPHDSKKIKGISRPNELKVSINIKVAILSSLVWGELSEVRLTQTQKVDRDQMCSELFLQFVVMFLSTQNTPSGPLSHT